MGRRCIRGILSPPRPFTPKTRVRALTGLCSSIHNDDFLSRDQATQPPRARPNLPRARPNLPRAQPNLIVMGSRFSYPLVVFVERRTIMRKLSGRFVGGLLAIGAMVFLAGCADRGADMGTAHVYTKPDGTMLLCPKELVPAPLTWTYNGTATVPKGDILSQCELA